ncbi:hypothetical protein SAMD00023353_7100200 [Rosellinia necatrix]|uniref:Uncharacterized protein n=1 Tax=Rosellinia necatrix TaxID=77044 RepID=A0A1S8AAH0_ROSNE|nr:hypothetical protein SAMD00023353_7100200 [Rosellinia necatrix]
MDIESVPGQRTARVRVNLQPRFFTSSASKYNIHPTVLDGLFGACMPSLYRYTTTAVVYDEFSAKKIARIKGLRLTELNMSPTRTPLSFMRLDWEPDITLL